jgi:hypothetical protein
MAPQVVAHPGARTTRRYLMAIEKSSAPHAHPSTEDHDDTLEAHYACLERPTSAWTAGCSLAALSSPSTTLMARSSSPSACRAAAAQLADSPTPIAHAATTGPESSGPTLCAIHPAGASLCLCASPRTSGRWACRSFGLRRAAGYSCHFTVSRTFCAFGRNSSNLSV